MSFWEISGEAGKALDENKVSLHAYSLSNGTVKKGSLIEDTFSFVQVFDDADDAATKRIDYTQQVSLWRDGTRFFQGVSSSQQVRDTTSGGLQINHVVSGVWWWMQQTPLSSEMSGSNGGTAEERISYALETGDLKDHLITVLTRAKALGVPIDIGTIDDCFDIPQITLKQMSCADAIAELMRWIPDAQSWIDYSPEGNPTFNLSRRSNADVATFTIGQAPCQSINIKPRLELEAKKVTVTSVSRAVDGRTVFDSQTAGAEEDGRRQILTVSGPELDSFLPNDLFESYVYGFQRIDAQSWMNTYMNRQDPGFRAAAAAGLTTQVTFTFAPTTVRVPVRIGLTTYDMPGSTFTRADGSIFSTYLAQFLVGESPPEWVVQKLGLIPINIKASWYAYTPSTNPPTWLNHLNFSIAFRFQGFIPGYTGALDFVRGDVTLQGWTRAAGGSGTLYKDADYDFVHPPNDLASNLLATQNWVPHEGAIGVASEEAGETDYLGKVVNIEGSLPQHANMKALVKAVQMDLESGTSSVELGVPARLNYLGLVNRFRRTASDNIKWL